MKELGQEYAENHAELHGVLEKLETALIDVDRMGLMVIGAQLSQVLEDVRALIEV